MLEGLIVNDYLRAFVLLVVFLFIIRVVLFFLEKFAISVSKKTKTDIDDILIEKSSKPLTMLAFLISSQIAVTELPLIGNISIMVTNLIYSMILITLAYLVYVIINVVVLRGMMRIARRTKSTIDDSLVSLFHSILRIALFVISLLYLLNLWGIEITPLLAGLGIAGLAVALALQPILSNVFSGAAIVLDKSVRVGDLIYLDSKTKGKIEKIGLRSTRILTFDNELIIVPNNKLADSIIQNVALPEPKSRTVIPFGVAYGSDIAKVKKIVLKEIKQIKSVVNEPKPIVRFREMADSSLNFKAYFYVDSFENRFAAIDEANTRIYNAFNKAGINIPFPQMDVHLKK